VTKKFRLLNQKIYNFRSGSSKSSSSGNQREKKTDIMVRHKLKGHELAIVELKAKKQAMKAKDKKEKI
jgi:hypothetical protein